MSRAFQRHDVSVVGIVLASLWLTIGITPLRGADADNEKVIRSARILFDARDFTGARRSLDDILRNNPDHAEALLWVARCDEQTGDSAAALKNYNRIIDLARADAKAVDETTRRQAALAIQRLDEGRKVVARYIKQMESDAERFKGKNDVAYATIASAIAALQQQNDLFLSPEEVKAAVAGDRASSRTVSPGWGCGWAGSEHHGNVYECAVTGQPGRAFARFWLATYCKEANSTGNVWLINPKGEQTKITNWSKGDLPVVTNIDKVKLVPADLRRASREFAVDISKLVQSPGIYRVRFEYTGGGCGAAIAGCQLELSNVK